MYAEGGAEEVVGQAIRDRRDEVYLVSKVYPHNASAKGVQSACERSLRRFRPDDNAADSAVERRHVVTPRLSQSF